MPSLEAAFKQPSKHKAAGKKGKSAKVKLNAALAARAGAALKKSTAKAKAKAKPVSEPPGPVVGELPASKRAKLADGDGEGAKEIAPAIPAKAVPKEAEEKAPKTKTAKQLEKEAKAKEHASDQTDKRRRASEQTHAGATAEQAGKT